MLNQYVETKLPRKKAWSKPKKRLLPEAWEFRAGIGVQSIIPRRPGSGGYFHTYTLSSVLEGGTLRTVYRCLIVEGGD